jgi:hypothetical protein
LGLAHRRARGAQVSRQLTLGGQAFAHLEPGAGDERLQLIGNLV